MRSITANRWCLPLLAAVMVLLTLSTLPHLAVPSNPQHMDQARAFLNGSVWIDRPTVSRDLGEVGSHWYSPFPPFPAIVAAAAIALSAHPDLVYNLTVLAAALGAVALSFLVGWRLGGPSAAAWAAVALGLGSGLWTATVFHDTWNSAHVFAVVASLAAVAVITSRHRSWFLAGLLIGIAGLARQPVVLGAPFLLVFARPRRLLRAAASLLLGAALPMSLYLGLNLARFGSVLTTGYAQIHHHPRILGDVAAHGVFSITFLPRNLAAVLAGMPRVISAFPYVVPNPNGLALWLVSPWLLLALLPLAHPDRPPARRLAIGLLLGSLAIAVPHLLYVNTGWVQFGARFALDEMPLLLVAALLAVRRGSPRLAWGVVGWAVTIHLWGRITQGIWLRLSTVLPG
jgi:4-amino-4-deoxy-L-arabinose transferase-like glycosyltransferase